MRSCGKTLSVALVFVLACGTLLPPIQAQPLDRVKVERTTLSLPTYPWLDDPNPVFAEYERHIYYPYTRQDHILKTKTDRQYAAIVLENEYLKVICLPDLGGRSSVSGTSSPCCRRLAWRTRRSSPPPWR